MRKRSEEAGMPQFSTAVQRLFSGLSVKNKINLLESII
jgi:hypothetical protein